MSQSAQDKFINQLYSFVDPRHQYINEAPNNNLAGGEVNNIAKGVGNLVQAPFQALGRAWNDLQNPSQIGPDIQNLAGNVASGLNNLAGQPVATSNGQVTGVQAPSIAESLHAMYNDPVGAALTVEGVKGGVGALKGKMAGASEGLPAKPGLLTKNDINQATPSDIAQNPYAQEDIQPMQDALNRNGVYNASQASQAMKDIYDKTINPELDSNPQVVPLDHVTNGVVQQMRKMQPGLDAQEALDGAHRSIINLYNSARNTTPDSQVIPTGISTKDLLDLKTSANQTLPVKNYYNNGVVPGNPGDLGTLATSKALTKIVGDYHPNIAQATKDYGLINDAYPSMYKASQLPPTNYLPPAVNALLPPQLATKVNTALPNIGSSAKEVGVGPVGAVRSGLPIIAASRLATPDSPQNVPSVVNGPEDQNPANQSNQTNGIISQPGRYQMQTPQGQGFLTTNDYTNQDNQLTQQIANAQASGDTVTGQRLAGQKSQLENSFGQQAPIRDKATELNQLMGIGNHAYNLIQKVPLSVLNFNGTFDSLMKSTNLQYAALGTALQNIQNQTGMNLAGVKNKQALVAMLDYAISSKQNEYNAQLQQYFGGNTLNPTAPQQANLPPVQAVPGRAAPTGQLGKPVQYNIDMGSPGQGLPQASWNGQSWSLPGL